ncbi:MAG: hypothetical protein IKA35_04590, partial [Bacteroidaceae bacterium]|nr:hypothetical protein [Bacteroidaceae bacterium]
MAKNSVKIIALVLAILLICSGLVFIISNNKTLAYSSSDRVYISQSIADFASVSKYYCLNKNLHYEPGYYIAVGEGRLDPIVAYAIGYEQNERKLGKTQHSDDAICNIVWDYMGDGRTQGKDVLYSEEFYDIVAKAELIQNLSEDDVSISSLETMLIQNSEGQYGPFTINFPSINDELVGKELKIIVNGTTEIAIEDLIKKDDGYYLTEEHGIQVGVENTIELEYTAWQYTGSYVEYAFEQKYVMQVTCPECGGTGKFTRPGGIAYIVNGIGVREDYDQVLWSVDPEEPFAHINEDCAGEVEGEIISEPGYYASQNIIDPNVECIPFLLYADLTFLAGTPDVEIEFNKINTEGEKLEGAIFDVNVVGGTVEGSSTITTTKEGNTLRIKPDKGSIAMTVTLTELKAPDKYAPLTESIILQYNWNKDTKQWDCNKSNIVLQDGEKV